MSTDLAVVLVLLAAMEAWRWAFHRRLGEPRDREGDTRMPRPAALVLGLLTLAVWSLAGLTVSGLADADVHDLRPGPFAGGVGAGFLTNTPDGVEVALNGHVGDVSLRGFAIGLLGQSNLVRASWLIVVFGEAEWSERRLVPVAASATLNGS
jgi:hypothetical protein